MNYQQVSNLKELPALLTVKDVLKVLPSGTGKNYAYSLFHRKDFPAIRHGKKFLVSRDAFIRWLEQQNSEQVNVTSGA